MHISTAVSRLDHQPNKAMDSKQTEATPVGTSTNTANNSDASTSAWGSADSVDPDVERMSREDAKRESQFRNMREAYSLAESMEAMTGEHPGYHEHFTALVQDLGDAGKRFTDKREVERMQLMTEAMSGMLTIRAMFEDLRSRTLKVKSADDPVTGSVFFEPRLIQTIKFFAKELHEFTGTMETGTTNIPFVPDEQAQLTGPTTPLVADSDVPLLAPVDATTGAGTGTGDRKSRSDEEIARELQDEEDAAYAKLLAKRVYYYRQPAGGVTAGPTTAVPAHTTAATATAGPITTLTSIDNQEVEAFVDHIVDTRPAGAQ